MALTTESAGKVRQKVHEITRDPGVFYALKGLFLHLAANKSNPDLCFKAIDGKYSSSDGDNNANQVLIDAACTLYCIYLKKSGSVANYVKITDHNTTCQTNGTQETTHTITTSGQEDLLLFPDGKAYATGITCTENTSANGSTLTLLANKVDGFIIVGA